MCRFEYLKYLGMNLRKIKSFGIILWGAESKGTKNLFRKDTVTLRDVKNVTFLKPVFQGLAFPTCPISTACKWHFPHAGNNNFKFGSIFILFYA